MARTDSLNNFLTDIANSIRNKKGTTDTIPASNFDTEIESIETGSTPVLQSKSITITENGTQNITYEEGYDGLNSVEVTTNVPSGGDVPEIGFIVKEWDSDGYPIRMEIVGMTSIPSRAFYAPSTAYKSLLNRVQEIILPEICTTINSYAFYSCTVLNNINISNCTTINSYAFYSCTNLGEISLPLATMISEYCFTNCTNLIIKSLPNLERFGSYGAKVFSACKNLKQLSMPKITGLRSNATQYSTFAGSGLIAVWIGSPVTQYGISNSTFDGASYVKKIFIDLPRETVEAMSNYSTAFSNNTLTTDVIICNDDEGFMTCEEFDAIDWSTYTE